MFHANAELYLIVLELGVGDTFWKFICLLNWAEKWFNSKQNPKYSFNRVHSIQSMELFIPKKLKKIIQNSNLINGFFGFHYLTSNYWNGIKYHGLNLF